MQIGETTLVGLEHCGQPCKHKSTRYGWEGEFEKIRAFFVCESCGTQVAIETREHVGPPEG